MTDGPPLQVFTFRELITEIERDARVRQHRRQWGRWRLDTATLELLLEEQPGRCTYPVDLEGFTSSAPMLDMIFQVAKKTWATAEDVGDLIGALQNIFDPQARLCGSGRDRKLDATAHLRARYREASA